MIKEVFQISKESQNNFTYLGLHIKQTGHDIDIDQEGYISDINPIVIEDERNRKGCEAITTSERQQLRAVIGQLNWLSTQTRPDIAYDTCIASVSFKEAKVKDLLRVNKIIRKLQSESVHLKFIDLSDLRRYRVINYSDASYRNLLNEGSQGGFIIFICNQHNQVAPIQWQSKKIRRVVRSTLAAESIAQLDAADASFLIKSLLVELLQCSSDKIKIESITDNKSLFETLYSTKTTENKRLRADIAALRERPGNGEIDKIHWVETSYQIADCLTKSGASTTALLDTLREGKISY